MILRSELIAIGTMTRLHGKRGEIQCRTLNTMWDEAEAEFIVLELDGLYVPFRVLDWRGKGEDLLFTLRGIDSEAAALRLVGAKAFMLRSDTDAEAVQMTSWSDIVGWTIIDAAHPDQRYTIRRIDDSTANILAELDDERLIPLHDDLVQAIDDKQHILTLTIPEGL
ncbi:MAG: hypothetical protein IJP52_02480 [Paludibacteraceae bacterium]|nr:hypothetical protein [Paludibacteraceae bacterium]